MAALYPPAPVRLHDPPEHVTPMDTPMFAIFLFLFDGFGRFVGTDPDEDEGCLKPGGGYGAC